MKHQEYQSNFTAGELSPLMYGVVDFAKYKNGLQTALNVVIVPQGPVKRRNGSQYIATSKLNTGCRLLPFQYDQNNYYILEFGGSYIRFYRNKGQIQSAPNTPMEISSPYAIDELFEISYVQFGTNLYLAHYNHAPRVLVWTSDTSWQLNIINFYPPATQEDGYFPNTTITPAATTGLGQNFTAGAATFLAADVGREIVNLSGTGRASITSLSSTTVVVCDIIEAFPSTSAIAANSWKLDLSPISYLTNNQIKTGATATINSTSDSSGATPVNTFRSANIGNYINMNNGVFEILSLGSASQVTCSIQKTANAVTLTGVWSIEDLAWSNNNGYPRTVCLFQQRLVFASTNAKPASIWMSETGVLNNFGTGSNDADSIEADLATNQSNVINWMLGFRQELILGTAGTELTIDSGGAGGPVTGSNITQLTRSFWGSKLQTPITVANELVYIQKSQRRIMAMRYDFLVDNYTSDDLTYLAEHITEGLINHVIYAQDPGRNILGVLEDGTMICGTYYKDQDIKGWARWETQGDYKSVASINVGSYDQVWCVVERTVNGSTYDFIEVFDNQDGTPATDLSQSGTGNCAGFSDAYNVYSSPIAVTGVTKANPCVVTATAHGLSNGQHIKFQNIGGMANLIGHTYIVHNSTTNTLQLTDLSGNVINSTAFSAYTSGGNCYLLVSSISGLSYLEGCTVEVKTDGASHPACVVSSGAISLDYPSMEVTVGLPYSTNIVTLNKEYNIGQGSQQGQRTRFVRPVLRLHNSALPMLNGYLAPARDPTMSMDSKVNLFSGDIFYDGLEWDATASLSISLDGPLPLVLNGIFGSLDGGSQ